MSSKSLKRFWASVASATLALSAVVGLSVNIDSARALDGSKFDPGLIISDSVFYDFGTMTAPQIQSFLDDKVPKCRLSPTDKFTCLRYYKTDIPAMSADIGRCDAIQAATDQSVAQMLVVIAKACNINPRVLLVTLQKEQGLVTSTNPYWPDSKNPGQPSTTKPLDYRYQIAMGFACPDTGPCTTFGFFYQVYKAASQFHWYGNPAGSFTYLKVGKNITMGYSPRGSVCGSKTFPLKSQATAALYYYTPYTPNQAALDNLYGTGDSCSAYGNRNFWRYYWDWFGSPIGGGFLLQSASSDVYLITENPATHTYEKHRLADAATATAFAPLGPVGQISQEYLDSFPTASAMTRLVKSATNQYFFVDGGRKFLFSACDQVATFGLDCNNAVQLTANQLSSLPSSGAMTTLVPDFSGPNAASASQYLISGGYKHAILDAASVAATKVSLPSLAPVPISAFSYLPWGDPIATEGVIFSNRTSGNKAIMFGGKYYEFATDTSADIDFKLWFPSSSGTLSADSVSKVLSNQPIESVVANSKLKSFALTPEGRVSIDTNAPIVANPPVLPDAFLNKIQLVDGILSTPFLAKAPLGKNTYFVANQVRRAVVNADSLAKLQTLATRPETVVLPPSVISQIQLAGPILAPGSLVKDPSGVYFITDGLSGLKQITNPSLLPLYGLGSGVKVAKSDLNEYTKTGSLGGFRILCGTQQYFSVSGVWQPIADSYASSYPGNSVALASETCANLKFGTTQLGRFVISPAKFTYLMSGGKRRLVNNAKQYQALRGTTPAAYKIDTLLNGVLQLGVPLPTNQKNPIPNPADNPPTPAATASPTPTPSSSPTSTPAVTPSASSSARPSASPSASSSAKPTPTPTEKPTPTPTKTVVPTKSPTPTPTPKVVTYVVVAGDTLTKIANRFGTTVSAIKAANGLIRDQVNIGQKLVIR